MKLHIFVETGIPAAKKNNKQYTNEWHFIQQYIKHLPNIKAKVYTYITAFKRNKGDANKVKNGDWNFCNVEYWDLDHAYLMPLKSFLKKYL